MPIDPKKIEQEQWAVLRTLEYVNNYVAHRINIHTIEIEKLTLNPGLDTGIKIQALHARVNELKAFLREAEYQKEVAKREAIND